MPDAVKTPAPSTPAPSTPAPSTLARLTLNSDGQSHRMLNIVTVLIFVIGIVAFALGLVVRAHFAATVLGIIGFAGGLWAQLNSATREERILIVTGIIGAFVGMALGIGHGGFS
jgi:hypothetical protein